MTQAQVYAGVAMSLNAIEQRLELLRARVSLFCVKLRRLG